MLHIANIYFYLKQFSNGNIPSRCGYVHKSLLLETLVSLKVHQCTVFQWRIYHNSLMPLFAQFHCWRKGEDSGKIP